MCSSNAGDRVADEPLNIADKFGIAVKDSVQEGIPNRAGSCRVQRNGSQLGDEVLPTVFPQHAGVQVDGAVLYIQKPGVGVEFVRADGYALLTPG